MSEVETHPVQYKNARGQREDGKRISTKVSMAAYEVYCHVFRPQDALVTGNCRGGFGTSELIAFLYARSFPKEEWRKRVNEALEGMTNM